MNMIKRLLAGLVWAGTRSRYIRHAVVLFAVVIMLILTPFSIVFASSWDIQTIEQWGDNGISASIALDSLGRVHVSYLEFDYIGLAYYLKYAFWDGSNWQKQYVAQAGDLPGSTSLVLDSNDRPRICYTYSRLGYLPILGYAKWDGYAWDLWGIDYGATGSLSLDINDKAHISYSNPYSVVVGGVRVPRSDLKYASGDGHNWQTQTIEYGGRIGEESSLALDSQMRPHVAYRDFGVVNGQLKYAAWNGSSWQIEVVDNQGDAGKNPSLAFDSVDRPCISYAGGDYSLKYARYNGAVWQIQTVEASAAHYLLPNSLALDTADRPHISYQNNGLSILKYATWNGAVWQSEIVDRSNSPGLYNSLALDSRNRPHICYYEAINGDLKYATADIQGCQSDFDHDGDVDGTDLSIFAADFGRTDCDVGDPCEGDFNDDDDVDGSDPSIFAGDFGKTDCSQ